MIGVFDSGVGGLAVLRELRALAPDADLVYLADQANSPYGEKGIDAVRAIAVAAVERLIEAGCDEVVIACNTASAAALDHLRGMFPGRVFVGMEPAVKPAAAATASGAVAVLATPTTFEGEAFDRLVGRHAIGVRVVPVACPGWAAAVEEAWPDGALEPVRSHLEPVLAQRVDTIALACTHYSFLTAVIEEVAGPEVRVIDPSSAVARQASRVADVRGSGRLRLVTTGDPVRFEAQIQRLLGWRVSAELA